MPQLPTVLAGPIVRRVTPRTASVWIALPTSQPVSVRVWEGPQVAAAGGVGSGDNALGSKTTQTRPFGPQFHVALVTVDFANALKPGTLYSYDVSVGNQTLSDLGLLQDEAGGGGANPDTPLRLALGYQTNRLPAFMTPARVIEEVRLAHASCRKPHGPATDAMAWIDDLIEESFTDPAARLQQLFLTGDQIYADDVAACLLPMLSGLASDLIGPTEKIVVNTQGGATRDVAATLTNFPADRRQKIVREMARFTSGSAHSHLLSFGEYVAMYLAVWSPSVWRTLADASDVIKAVPGGMDGEVERHATKWEECAQEKKKTLTELRGKSFSKGLDAVEGFRSTVPKVARVLANCATYMIFDDHEVTDDWNLNGRWRNRVYATALGRNIVRNGVMAYAVCQAWGNDPSAFAPGQGGNAKNRELLDQAQALFGTPPAGVSADATKADRLSGIGTTSQAATFNYKVEGPEHLVVVLDTRTRRQFPGPGLESPSLLGPSLSKQVPAAPLPGGRRLMLLVSPVPVLGPHLIERIAAPLGQISADIKSAFFYEEKPCGPAGNLAGVEQFDAESWVSNENAFEELLRRIAPYQRLVILSGDVHYGCSVTLDYWRKDTASPDGVRAPDRIVQLTSSPSHNNFDSHVEAVLRSSAHLQRYQSDPRPERLGWTGPSPINVPAGQSIPPGRRARMGRTPALVTTQRWPAGTSIPTNGLPDWRWRLSLWRDERPESELPVALRKPQLSADVSPADAAPGYRALAARHGQTALTAFDHLRQMVFTPNVGIVQFLPGAGAIPTVRHTMLSRAAPGSVLGAPNTVHEIALTPSTEPVPTLEIEGG